jgi:hypothetical protein
MFFIVKCADGMLEHPAYVLAHQTCKEVFMPIAESSSKRCFKCGESKPLDQFYPHPAMADGHLNKCKDCTKADVRARRSLDIDRVRAYDRHRGNLPHRVRARHEYSKTSQGRQAVAAAKQSWEQRNSLKKRAVTAVNNALRSGALVKPSECTHCGAIAARIEGHHPDYSMPLSVIWLCDACHKNEHKRLRALQRQETKT